MAKARLSVRHVSVALLFVLALGVVVLATPSPQPAYAGLYYRSGAAAYAEQWTSNTDLGEPVRRNPDYPNFGNDCTNYVSQVLYAGGYPPRGSNDNGCFTDQWWKPDRPFGIWRWTWSWSVADCQRLYMNAHHEFQLWGSVTSLQAADMFQLSQDGSGLPTHARVTMGAGYDALLGTFESQLINQHTTDRKHRYWYVALDPAWPVWAWHVAW